MLGKCVPRTNGTGHPVVDEELVSRGAFQPRMYPQGPITGPYLDPGLAFPSSCSNEQALQAAQMMQPQASKRTHMQRAVIGFAVCMCLVMKQLAGVVACLCLATGSPSQAVHQGEHAHLDAGGHAHHVHGTEDCADEHRDSEDEGCHPDHSCEQHLPHSLGDHEETLREPNQTKGGPVHILALVPDNRVHLNFIWPTGVAFGSLGDPPLGPPPPKSARPRAPPLSS